MKKSTILMLVVIYIVAFFVVGLMGIQLRSHYHVEYLNEIQVTPFEESQLVLKDFKQVQINEGQDVGEEKKRLQNTYEYETTTTYSADMVLKFYVKLIPENTTIDEFKLDYESSGMYEIVQNQDKTLFVQNIKKLPKTKATTVKFTVQDQQKHNIKTEVTVRVKF